MAVGPVLVLRSGSGERTAHMRQIVELGFQVRIFGAATAGCRRIAALGHEAVDHPVEHRAVVKTFLGQQFDPFNMVRRNIGAQQDSYPSAG